MKSWGTWAGAAIAALWALACKSGDGGSPRQHVGGGGEGGGPATTVTGTLTGRPDPGGDMACAGQPPALDLEGTWAGFGRLTAHIRGREGGLVSICPEDQQGQSSLVVRVTVTQTGTRLDDVRATVCALDLPPVTTVAGTCTPGARGAITTQISLTEALQDALPNLVPTRAGGVISSAGPGSAVDFDRFVITAGSSVRGPALPEWRVNSVECGAFGLGRGAECETACVTDCSALRDDDADGYPAVTLDVCGRSAADEGRPCNTRDPSMPGVLLQGRAFAAIEVDPRFSGVASSSCRIDGTVSTNVRYSVIGGDVVLSGLALPISIVISALPELEIIPEQSPMTLIRVDGKYGSPNWNLHRADPDTACQTILAHGDELSSR